jgi:hypothetical protein
MIPKPKEIYPPRRTNISIKQGFLDSNEKDYIDNFDELIADSYSDLQLAPSELKKECYGKGQPFTENDENVVTATSVSTIISASDLQLQCGNASICIVPSWLTVEMNKSINVAALIVRGRLQWTDKEQGSGNMWLCAGYVAIEDGGIFHMDLSSAEEKTGYIFIKDNGLQHKDLGTRAFGAVGKSKASYIEISGRPLRRTWSLLAKPLIAGTRNLTLMHDPILMNWKIGDRILVGPTERSSEGQAQDFRIVGFGPNNQVELDMHAVPLKIGGEHVTVVDSFKADLQYIPLHGKPVASLRSAEVIHLTRNIIITGDDFRHIECDPKLGNGYAPVIEGCRCSDSRKHCTMGLHTIHMFNGIIKIKHARVEKCGQRGVLGKYCMHYHLMGDCPECIMDGNAIEFGHQRALVVHGTHRTLNTFNVVNDVRGAAMYIEDGNEMYNTMSYNVLICPWGNNDRTKRGCSVPGTANGQADTALNQVGIWVTGPRNHMIGNRASNSFNGMLYNPLGNGVGAVNNKLCYIGKQEFARFDGNTFHSHGRFGTYGLGALFPKKMPSQTVSSNGLTPISSECEVHTSDGYDNGVVGLFNNNFDYGNTFVGHYSAGDIQYRRHVSLQNGNLLYWKEAKNMADGCAALIKDSYYSKGNVALPDEGAHLIENTIITGSAGLEANHHCHVGATGILCQPTYVFHNTKRYDNSDGNQNWCYFGGSSKKTWSMANGGIFTLSPPNCLANHQNEGIEHCFFPKGYCSVVDYRYDYLVKFGHNVDNKTCSFSSTLDDVWPGKSGSDLKKRYNNGNKDSVLCKVPLRTLKIFSRNFNKNWQLRNVPDLHVELWYDNNKPEDKENSVKPDVETRHRSGFQSHSGYRCVRDTLWWLYQSSRDPPNMHDSTAAHSAG